MNVPPAAPALPALSSRLAVVSGLVRTGEPMADVGTDHGYLPVDLVGRGVVPRAVASDRRAAPLAAAERTILAAGLTGRVDLRLGDGLTVLAPGEVSTVVIAGLGGALMSRLLAAQPAVVRELRRVVLQPNTGAEGLRRWLTGHGWRLSAEDLVAEGDRLSVVLAAEPDPDWPRTKPLSEMDLILGPILRSRQDDLQRQHVAGLLAGFRRIAAGLVRARQPDPGRVAAVSARVEMLAVTLVELERTE